MKNIQTELQKQAGVTSTYQTETKAGTVYQLISSGIVGQSKANTILQGFQKASGLTAVLQTVTAGKPYYIVTSAAQSEPVESTDAPYPVAKGSKDQREDSKDRCFKKCLQLGIRLF
ncbi:hypothetical protein BsIDN1_63180 [Bacillus safensis]|uniref:Uncharacterized protein n=1 Tax=Bacillus safensis TaxID=561879 RepID=A0A5S9MGS9_BACIA|nr:hypothetical protein BsIDN1_63180 [Bacillus safensis]